MFALFVVFALAGGAVVQAASTACPKLGHDIRDQFLLSDQYVNLNHGSFGSPPKVVLDAKLDLMRRVEANPDLWFRWDMYNLMDNERAALAKYINADPADVVFVINASHGMNAVLKSLKVPSNKRILYVNEAYQMVKNTLYFLEDQFDTQLLEVNLTYPTTKEQIISQIVAVLDAHPGEIHVATFSHIVSIPSFIMPVAELVVECHKRGILVVIDGAHCVGHIPLDVPSIGADFYVSNGHKWLYTTKGSAFLWVNKAVQSLVFPPIINDEGQGKSFFQMSFSYEGTMDYTNFLTFSPALQFRATLCEDNIFSYMHTLAASGGKLLADSWQTSTLFDDSLIGAMVDVQLPACANSTVLENLAQQLLQEYNTYVPVFPLVTDSGPHYFVRVSAQVYNDLSDFQYYADAVKAVFARDCSA